MTENQEIYETEKFLSSMTRLGLAAHLSTNPDKTVSKLAKKYRKKFKSKQLNMSLRNIAASREPAKAVLISLKIFMNEMPFKRWFHEGGL